MISEIKQSVHCLFRIALVPELNSQLDPLRHTVPMST